MEGDCRCPEVCHFFDRISIHSLRMEGDPALPWTCKCPVPISIHSLRMEGDSLSIPFTPKPAHFNPLPPHGGRLYISSVIKSCGAFQSTPSAWRETSHPRQSSPYHIISIHSLRMEGDFLVAYCVFHVPAFQSTPSAWRETYFFHISILYDSNFNPLPPHGGRQLCYQFALVSFAISIHSLRMEGDKKYGIR